MANSEAQAEKQKAALQKRTVVSSFLFKYDDVHARAAEVALFHRSDKVRTHYLAPISGSIDHHADSNPLDAAWRELEEETSLTSSAVKLWRKGRPFTFQDYSVGREWTIYPFAFLLKSTRTPTTQTTDDKDTARDGETDGVVLDWEHDFHNWYDPDEVLSRLFERGDEATVSGQKLVPRIADSLIRVYPEYELGPVAGRRLREGLQQLQDDHESGARELATVALNIFKDILYEVRPSIKYERESHCDEGWRKVRLAAWHIWTNGRESMGAAIASALLTALAGLEVFYRDVTQDGENVKRFMNSLVEKRKAMTRALSEAFTVYINNEVLKYREANGDDNTTLRILTLSASSTIRESILHLLSTTTTNQVDRIQTVELRVLESRPLYEGVSLASSIISSYKSHQKDGNSNKKHPKLKVTLYSDASAALASADVDVFLLGADRIAADGAVSNKTGSLPAILAAKYISPRTRVLVLSELDKVAEPDPHNHRSHLAENSSPEEIMRGWRAAATEGRGLKGRLEAIEAAVNDRAPAKQVEVDVKNVYFEWVPPELIDAYLTDDGIKVESDIRQRSTWVEEQIHRFFDDL